MNCKVCGGALPPELPKQTRYCSTACKSTARKATKDKWYSNNKQDPEYKQKVKEASKKHHSTNKGKRNTQSRDYYHRVRKNKPDLKEYRRKVVGKLKENPEWVEAKKEKDREYYLKTKEQRLQKVKEYKEKNPARVRQWIGSRKKALKERTPKWLTQEHWDQMNHLYWLCKDLKATTGEDYHVDHIVPLQGENVSGLHVPWNLQVLPSDLNLSKGRGYSTV
jgi:hypothetical protein